MNPDLSQINEFLNRHHDVLNVLVTIAGVIVACCGVIAAFWTLWQIKRQADLLAGQIAEGKASSKVAKAAAKAALEIAKATRDQVNALINSERAWVTIEPFQAPFQISDRSDFVVCHLINRGRTAARIESTKWKLEIVEHMRTLTGSPLAMSITETASTQDILVPGETLRRYFFAETFGPASHEQIAQNMKGLFFHGLIVYRDLANEQRTNRFCFRYVHEGRRVDGDSYFWRVEGPPGFINHT